MVNKVEDTQRTVGASPSRRVMLGALAATSAASVPAIAGVSGSSPLFGRIDAHRRAYDTFLKAIDRENELDEAYEKEFPPEKSPIIPSLLGGGYGMRNGRDGCKENIAAGFQR
jgi:hypothetical protein